MSGFLEGLRHCIKQARVFNYITGVGSKSVNDEPISTAFSMIDSLGENARRMLDVGILQDELVKLGFSRFGLCEYALTDGNGTQKIGIDFVGLVISTSYFGGEQYHYSFKSPTWQQDISTKVKELINE